MAFQQVAVASIPGSGANTESDTRTFTPYQSDVHGVFATDYGNYLIYAGAKIGPSGAELAVIQTPDDFTGAMFVKQFIVAAGGATHEQNAWYGQFPDPSATPVITWVRADDNSKAFNVDFQLSVAADSRYIYIIYMDEAGTFGANPHLAIFDTSINSWSYDQTTPLDYLADGTTTAFSIVRDDGTLLVINGAPQEVISEFWLVNRVKVNIFASGAWSADIPVGVQGAVPTSTLPAGIARGSSGRIHMFFQLEDVEDFSIVVSSRVAHQSIDSSNTVQTLQDSVFTYSLKSPTSGYPEQMFMPDSLASGTSDVEVIVPYRSTRTGFPDFNPNQDIVVAQTISEDNPTWSINYIQANNEAVIAAWDSDFSRPFSGAAYAFHFGTDVYLSLRCEPTIGCNVHTNGIFYIKRNGDGTWPSMAGLATFWCTDPLPPVPSPADSLNPYFILQTTGPSFPANVVTGSYVLRNFSLAPVCIPCPACPPPSAPSCPTCTPPAAPDCPSCPEPTGYC